MIKPTTLRKNLNTIYNDRKFNDKQISFFKFALEQINNDRDTDNITVFPARCGLGKSTFLKALVKSWLEDNTDSGLIIVTDNLTRLNEINDETDRRIAYLTADNKETEILRQAYCPVLLISTQRYFQMDSIDQFLHYYDNGVSKTRDTIIFDESPYFYEDGEIGITEINLLHSALNDGISDLCSSNDKQWIVGQFDSFRQNLIETINGLEQKRNQTTYLFYQPDSEWITDDDIRFYSILENNTDVYKKYPQVKKILFDLEELLKNGGFFCSFKLRDNNDYHKSFMVRHSYIEKFKLGGEIKTFIFDATADISEMYPTGAEWLNVLDCSDFNVPLDFLKVHIVDVNTSRNALIKKESKDKTLKAIKDYISEKVTDRDDTLFVTYKALLESREFDEIGFTLDNSLYFGNAKGFNDSREKHNYIQVGLNRQSDIKYLLNLLSNDEVQESFIKNENILNIQRNIAAMDSLLRSDLVDSYRCAEVCADFLQNLFRTKARNIDNREEINVYLFCSYNENMKMELNYWLANEGATIDVVELEALKKDKITNRRGDTKPKTILNWLDRQPQGFEFTVEEMLDELGLSARQFKTVKRGNKYVKSLFDRMKVTGKRGVYRKVA